MGSKSVHDGGRNREEYSGQVAGKSNMQRPSRSQHPGRSQRPSTVAAEAAATSAAAFKFKFRLSRRGNFPRGFALRYSREL